MAVSIDNRPSYFGDRMIVTGSYEATDVFIDLTSLLVSIDMAVVNAEIGAQQTVRNAADDGITRITFFDYAIVDPTQPRIVVSNGQESGETTGGTFFAIGRRS